MDPLIDQKIVSPPKEEFYEFCKNRINGLRLTLEDSTLQLYQEALEQGMNELEPEKGENT